jgi:hypothetical protein
LSVRNKTIFYNQVRQNGRCFVEILNFYTMKRAKSFDVPHKGLRNALSQLSLLAGKTNYSNPAEVAGLHALGEVVFKLLNIHAVDEDAVIFTALEERCRGCSQHYFDDHAGLHIAQDKLEKLLSHIYNKSQSGGDATEDGDEFYLALSAFHGEYLAHIAEEERMAQPLLWQYFTDAELAEHRREIIAKNPPQMLLIWFRFVIPAQSAAERVGLLSGFKKMASPAFFNEGMEAIGQVLTTEELAALRGSLEGQ